MPNECGPIAFVILGHSDARGRPINSPQVVDVNGDHRETKMGLWATLSPDAGRGTVCPRKLPSRNYFGFARVGYRGRGFEGTSMEGVAFGARRSVEVRPKSRQ